MNLPENRQRRRGTQALATALAQGCWHIVEHASEAVSLLLSVALGVALAITIIAAGNGVNDKVTALLAVKGLPTLINVDQIHQVLVQTRTVLIGLAYAFTVVLVVVVTWISMARRRRDIGLHLQHGLYMSEVLIELLAEATLLCVAGGLVGIGLGYVLCAAIAHTMPLLPLHPKTADVLTVFHTVTGISFCATAAVGTRVALLPTWKSAGRGW